MKIMRASFSCSSSKISPSSSGTDDSMAVSAALPCAGHIGPAHPLTVVGDQSSISAFTTRREFEIPRYRRDSRNSPELPRALAISFKKVYCRRSRFAARLNTHETPLVRCFAVDEAVKGSDFMLRSVGG